MVRGRMVDDETAISLMIDRINRNYYNAKNDTKLNQRQRVKRINEITAYKTAQAVAARKK